MNVARPRGSYCLKAAARCAPLAAAAGFAVAPLAAQAVLSKAAREGVAMRQELESLLFPSVYLPSGR